MALSSKLDLKTSVPLELLDSFLARPLAGLIRDPRELATVELLKVCPVCYNMDPWQALSANASHRSSWADEEYHVPDGMPVAKVTIKESKKLFQSAREDCIYCAMIVNALEAVHSGWEAENTYVQIYLAADIPVAVRLSFGGINHISIDPDRAHGLGWYLPEGRNATMVAQFVAHGKEAVDVEIYRPVIPGDQRTIGELVFEPMVQNMGFAKEIAKNAGDQECVDFIKKTISTCMKHHTCGNDEKSLPLLPDRIIWIEAYNDTGIQLVESPRIRARYIALSYCWGPVNQDTYLTTSGTLRERKLGMRYRDLPRLFQDVMKTARALGIEYIWIDRLCIIQGNDEDFHSQAPKMGEIYGNATLTIAAASANTENDGILTAREDMYCSPFNCSFGWEGVTPVQARSRRLWHPLSKEKEGGKYGKLSTRAWIWQERLLATRTIFFTPGGLKFECRRHSVWEGFQDGQTGHSWSTQLENVTETSWTKLVEEYMRRDITRPSDRPHAIEAVVKRVQRATNWSPCWGLWEDNLTKYLAWCSVRLPGGSGYLYCRPNPGHHIPSWSWLSIEGPVSYANANPLDETPEADPMQWELQTRIADASSGIIRAKGLAIRVLLQVKVRLNEAYKGYTKEADRYTYTYTIAARPNHGPGGLGITPDVPLKPWTDKLNGRQDLTVARVSADEDPPMESWSGICVCLLLGTRKLASLGLLLGWSVQKRGAFSRIGISYGLPPDAFADSKPMEVSLV